MFLNLKFQYSSRRNSGFTLLELLLVVFIMSVLAFSAVSLTDTMESSQDQFRYERARNQAADLKKAIIDRVDGQEVVSGFVADMGDLPDNMTELAFGVVDKNPDDEEFTASRPVTPVFDPTPDNSDFYANNSGDEVVLLDSLDVIKGYRGSLLQTDEATPRPFYIGNYLNLTPGKNIYDGVDKPRFDDGWGNQSPAGSFTPRSSYTIPSAKFFGHDEHTHGWNWYFASNHDLHFLNYGKDGSAADTNDSEDLYSEDLLLATVSEGDWSVDSSAIHVELQNDAFEVKRDCSDLRPVLLVFNAKENNWRTILGPVFGWVAGGGVSRVTFPSTFRVPAGTHILLLTKDLLYTTTPLGLADEVQASEFGSTQPAIQRLLFSADSRGVPYMLRVHLPDPDAASEYNSADGLNYDKLTYYETTFNLKSISEKIDDLNVLIANAEEYDQDPLDYIATDNTIKIDPQAGSTWASNPPLLPIEIEFDPSYGNNQNGNDLLVRAKHVNILPGQTNILQINLSSTVKVQP